MMTAAPGTRLRAALTALALVLPFAALTGGGEPADARQQKPTKSFFADFFPPNPADQVLKQPDGTGFKARLTPGEVGGLFETLDGYSVGRGEDRVWRYVSGWGASGPVLTSAVVGRDAPPRGLRRAAGRRPDVFRDPMGNDLRAQVFRQLQIASYKAQMQAAAEGGPRVFRFPVIMLATWWDAEAEQTQPQFQEGNTAEHFTKILDGFGGNSKGTLTEFYWENSFGQFLVEVDVFGPYTSQRSREDRCYYGGIEQSTAGGDLDLLDGLLGVGGGGAFGMAAEAVPQADPDINFAEYDNDGDHYVDFLGIIHSGPDMAVTGDPCHTWSHAIDLAPIPTSDAVVVQRLFTMPEFDQKGSELNIGVATHEMLHALGEPDYYNTSYGSAGTGDWDIMAGGSYLGNPPGSNPSGFNPATRVFQGWLTPTVVNGDLRGVKIPPRNVKPAGYTVGKPAPGLLLVPVKEIEVGEEDETGHTWTEEDVYGLAKNPETEKYVIEGYYLENMSRTVNAPPTHQQMERAPYFDRKLLASGIMVWHWDYWLRSNIYYGSNNAQSDPNRPQLDPVEFDFNDNTQELQLDKSRGNPEDLMFSAATGITSGTRMLEPHFPPPGGEPQEEIAFSGVVPAGQHHDFRFTVEDDPDNYLMVVEIVPLGDCKLQLFYGDGSQATGEADSGFIGDPERVQMVQPTPGEYIARVGDFAGCTTYDGTVKFFSPQGFLPTKGAGDTWSNWSKAATGWAFTNVGPDLADGLDHSADAGGDESITLDVVNIGANELDVSPGFVTAELNEDGGSGTVSTGAANRMTVPVFNNGGKAATNVPVTVRLGSATGRVIASGTIPRIAPYSRTYYDFSFTPATEGFWHLYTTVDDRKVLAEVHEGNNTQRTEGWAGPANPSVLVIDDDGALDAEASYTGALAALGIPYAIATEHPSLAELRKYEAVVWEAGGDRNKGQLDSRDRANVRAYLNGGGKLFLSSPRIVNAMGAPVSRTTPDATVEAQNTLKQYFGADLYITDKGLEQGPVVNNEDMTIRGTGTVIRKVGYRIGQIPGRHVIDVMRPAQLGEEGQPEAIGQAAPVMQIAGAPEGQYLGMRVVGDAAHKNFQPVLLGYNLSQHLHPDEYVSIMRDVMTFFGVRGGRYTVRSAEPVIYHTAVRDQVSGRATPVRATVLGGTPGQPVTVFYRRHGQGGYHSRQMVPGREPGSYHAVIEGRAITPDGVDYFIKAGRNSSFDPPSASTGRIAHAIGVARPEVVNPIAILPGGPVAGPPRADGGDENRGRPLPATGAPVGYALAAAAFMGGAVLVRRYALRREA